MPEPEPGNEVTITTEGRKITIGYERKKGMPNYSSETCSIYLTEVIPDGMTIDGYVAQSLLPQMEDFVKISVWNALGFEWGHDEAGRPIHYPEVNVEEQHRVAPPTAPPGGYRAGADPRGATPPPRASRPGSSGTTKMAGVGVYAELPQFCGQGNKKGEGCGAQGYESFYDNRADIDDRITRGGGKIGPDYKCKTCGTAVFRPGSYEYNQAVGQPAQAPVSQQPPPYDEAPF